MAQRIHTLPFQRKSPGLPSMEIDPKGNWIVCMASHSCIQSIESFAQSHQTATVFDFEHFQMGWQAGYQYACRMSTGESDVGA
jgi:hypothetical protein